MRGKKKQNRVILHFEKKKAHTNGHHCGKSICTNLTALLSENKYNKFKHVCSCMYMYM